MRLILTHNLVFTRALKFWSTMNIIIKILYSFFISILVYPWTRNFKFLILRQKHERLYDNILDQEDFIWQKIWQTSIHSFKVRWNYYLVNYYPLMYRYRINTNVLQSTFSRAEFWSFRIKCQSLQEYLMKKQMNWSYMEYYVEMPQYFTDKNQLLYFKCRENWKGAGVQI